MNLNPDTLITRSSQPVETTVGTEIVLMTLDTGECIGLGESGSDVWRLLAEPLTFSHLTDRLRATWDAPANVLEDDVRELLESMQQHKLVTLG